MKPTQSLSVLFLALGLGAQAPAVFPSDHAAIPNGSSQQNFFPYSFGVSRMMALYESWDLTVPTGHQITRIGFRANGTTIAYGKSLTLEVRMGSTDRTADTVLTNFANNYVGAPVTVFGPALFVMPDLNNPLNPNPTGSIIWVNLTTPYTYDASHNLLVEWRVSANSNGGAAFPYTLDVGTFVSPITSGPIGCMHSGNQIPELGSRPTKVGGTWYDDLTHAPANQLTVLVLNAGLPLTAPWPLAWGIAGVQPTCQVQVSFGGAGLATMVGVTGPTGNLTFSVPIPNAQSLNDLVVSSQALCFDAFAPGGWVVSNGDEMQIGIDPAMSAIYHQGSATNATGSLHAHWGIVTLFDYN